MQVVHKGIKVSGQNLVRRRVSWFCCTALRRNVGTIVHYDEAAGRAETPFDFENDDLFDGKKKTNKCALSLSLYIYLSFSSFPYHLVA